MVENPFADFNLDKAIGLRWTLRDIQARRTKLSPVSDEDLRVLADLGLAGRAQRACHLGVSSFPRPATATERSARRRCGSRTRPRAARRRPHRVPVAGGFIPAGRAGLAAGAPALLAGLSRRNDFSFTFNGLWVRVPAASGSFRRRESTWSTRWTGQASRRPIPTRW